jgi:hypothetical protein
MPRASIGDWFAAAYIALFVPASIMAAVALVVGLQQYGL